MEALPRKLRGSTMLAKGRAPVIQTKISLEGNFKISDVRRMHNTSASQGQHSNLQKSEKILEYEGL